MVVSGVFSMIPTGPLYNPKFRSLGLKTGDYWWETAFVAAALGSIEWP